MNRILMLSIVPLFLFSSINFASTSEPDSAYIFAYATDKNGGRNGLHFAWSLDKKDWHSIGPEFSFLHSDYGTWAGEKRMITPFLFQALDGQWHAVWSVNDRDGAFTYTTSKDLIHWCPQSFPIVSQNKNLLLPEISCDKSGKQFIVSWESNNGSESKFFGVKTSDFSKCSLEPVIDRAKRLNLRKNIRIGTNVKTGTVHKVPWNQVERLINEYQLVTYNDILDRETTDDDPIRFKDIEKIDATIIVDGTDKKKISDELIGVFFEDINYAADGGLYAELIQNRDFEYNPHDKKGRDSTWTSLKAWRVNGSGGTVAVDTLNPIHANNKHYAVLQIDKVSAGLMNEGFGGIAVKAGESYNFSICARNPDNQNKKLLVRLVGSNKEVCGETFVNISSTKWQKFDAEFKAKMTISDATLEIVPQTAGSVALDMISLFPRKTFKNRKNGLRDDLAQTIADIHPKFIRFPGGCVVHGDGLGNIYRWKDTIGPLEARKPQRNIWGYHQSYGLGYFEYFQFCEDIGAQPIPIVAAGVPCQNSSDGGAGQQCGIPMSEMDDYVQEVLDLIEWANGDKNTSWGKKRAEAGHPAPFNLKYLGVGNEDLISEIFMERFEMIYNAVKEHYPEITVIGTVGPFYKGSDYEEGWRFANKLELSIVDEHYYRPPGWFIHNQDYYDKYDRSKSKVYLGEYASHLPGRPSNIETALSEALYLTAVERNGDVVLMSSYAPLLAKEGSTQWRPDLIYFNNTEVKPTVDYYVQKLYGNNSGDFYIPSIISLSDERSAVHKRVAASVVQDSETKDVILKLVNLLPVDVNTEVKLEGFGNIKSSAMETVLTGHPDDEDTTPIIREIEAGGNFKMTLPGYSFTIIRLKTNKK